MRIEECSARQQARIDGGRQTIVGVNKYVDPESSKHPLNVRFIDNKDVLSTQIRRLKQLRLKRDENKVKEALQDLERAAHEELRSDNTNNLLHLSVNAARVRATVGEISYALEKVWGRYEATGTVNTGTYRAEAGAGSSEEEKEVEGLLDATARFERDEGRRPRILVAKMGMDGHDRGARVMATGLADLGFDVDLGPLFMTPKEVARQAIDADVHLVR